MNLITRSDFDGLACGALLYEAGIIDTFTFKHPKDIQDGLVPVTENDVLANVPFVEGCGLWFDHHSSEFERQELEGKYKGESRITPSCARIIYEYYGGKERFPYDPAERASVALPLPCPAGGKRRGVVDGKILYRGGLSGENRLYLPGQRQILRGLQQDKASVKRKAAPLPGA